MIKLKLSFTILCTLIAFGCRTNVEKLPIDIQLTTCFKTNASLRTTYTALPSVKIVDGDSITFELIRDQKANREIINGDTIKIADTDFYERVTFSIPSKLDSFFYHTESLRFVNGYYEFHGGENLLANTDFKIKKGYIKGHKSNDTWLINASLGVVDKLKADSVIREINFKETFQECR